jgi:hypothetical protein
MDMAHVGFREVLTHNQMYSVADMEVEDIE